MSNEYLTHVSLGHLDHCVIEWTPCNVIYTAEIREFVRVIFKCAESKKCVCVHVCLVYHLFSAP